MTLLRQYYTIVEVGIFGEENSHVPGQICHACMGLNFIRRWEMEKVTFELYRLNIN